MKPPHRPFVMVPPRREDFRQLVSPPQNVQTILPNENHSPLPPFWMTMKATKRRSQVDHHEGSRMVKCTVESAPVE